MTKNSTLDTTGLPLILKPRQAGQVLDLPYRTVTKLMATGVLPTVSIGGRRFVPRDALTRWISDHTESAA